MPETVRRSGLAWSGWSPSCSEKRAKRRQDELGEGALDRVLDSVITANGGPLPDDVAVFCVSKV